MTLLEELCVSQEPQQNSVPTLTTTGIDLTDITCWVARAVYGQDNPGWMRFRTWMLTESPAWFRALYLRHGRSFARWVSPRPRVRAALRHWMDSVIDSGAAKLT